MWEKAISRRILESMLAKTEPEEKDSDPDAGAFVRLRNIQLSSEAAKMNHISIPDEMKADDEMIPLVPPIDIDEDDNSEHDDFLRIISTTRPAVMRQRRIIFTN